MGLGRVDRQGRVGSASSTAAIEADHPLVGNVDRAVAFRRGEDEEIELEDDTEGDLCGHGTACAGIVRSLAPECTLVSARVLGAGFKGSGPILLEWSPLGGRAGIRRRST